jgi:hypothetical protein
VALCTWFSNDRRPVLLFQFREPRYQMVVVVEQRFECGLHGCHGRRVVILPCQQRHERAKLIEGLKNTLAHQKDTRHGQQGQRHQRGGGNPEFEQGVAAYAVHEHVVRLGFGGNDAAYGRQAGDERAARIPVQVDIGQRVACGLQIVRCCGYQVRVDRQNVADFTPHQLHIRGIGNRIFGQLIDQQFFQPQARLLQAAELFEVPVYRVQALQVSPRHAHQQSQRQHQQHGGDHRRQPHRPEERRVQQRSLVWVVDHSV